LSTALALPTNLGLAAAEAMFQLCVVAQHRRAGGSCVGCVHPRAMHRADLEDKISTGLHGSWAERKNQQNQIKLTKISLRYVLFNGMIMVN
jgi:hypothetical protein